MDEKQELIRYYEQMKQSILENSNYVDALMETAEAVYTVDLTNDCLENAFYHVKRESIIINREMPCSYDAYCRERSQKVTDDTLESYRIMDSSEKLLKRFREGDKQITVEYREEKQDGRMIWLQKTILMSQELLYDRETGKEHSAVHGIILFKNTSEFHKKEEEEKERLQKAVQEADAESKAKTDFMNRISHDIRTPMNAILGYSKLMRGHISDPEMQHYQEMIEQSGNVLLSIINNVLDMARIESGEMELDENYSETGNIVSGVCSVFEMESQKKNLTIEHYVNVQHPDIICDKTKMQEVLTNIIDNAVKYTPPGGTITITTDELPDEREGYIKIRTVVEDTGIGMSREFLPHLFDSFTRERDTTSAKVVGTGLGMAIVKSLIDLMDGSVTVESELGKGTKFTVTIPHKIAPPEYYAKKASNEANEKVEFSGKHILLAEDNDLNAEIAILLLEEMGFSVDRVEDGIFCVDKLEK